ncbi:MAG: hypothetical protein AAB288_14910, partial [Acidobacteriota bacterium]
MVITDVLREPNGCTITMNSKKVNLLFAKDIRKVSTFLPNQYQKVIYVLRNQKRGEMFLPKDEPEMPLDLFGKNRRLVIAPILLHFESEPDLPQIDEAWLADADLVRVEAKEAGTLPKILRIENFVMKVKIDEKMKIKTSN